jgi:hypothetical protein
MPGSMTTARPFRTTFVCLLWAAMWALGGCSGGDEAVPAGGERQPFITDARVGPRTHAAGTAKHGKRRPEAQDFKAYVLGKR